MSVPQKNKYLYLFEDPDVKRWYDNLARGSRGQQLSVMVVVADGRSKINMLMAQKTANSYLPPIGLCIELLIGSKYG